MDQKYIDALALFNEAWVEPETTNAMSKELAVERNREHQRKYYNANKEKIQEARRTANLSEEELEKRRAQNRAARKRHYDKNREKILEENRIANLPPDEQERKRAKNREYAKAHRERVKASSPPKVKQKPGPKPRLTPEERKANDLAARRRRYAEGAAQRAEDRAHAKLLRKKQKLEAALQELNQALGTS